MAITLLTPNLNTWGGEGKFEADKSTWGFGLTAPLVLFRNFDSGAPSIFYVARAILPHSQTLAFPATIAKGRATLSGGKKYVAYAFVNTPVGANYYLGGVNETYALETAPGTPNITSEVQTAEWNAVDVRGEWKLLETRIETSAFSGTQPTEFRVVINSTDPDFTNGGFPRQANTDNFFIYEYEDVVDPEYDCTLTINVAGTVIVHSTGVNGSITVALTGGTGPFEYSKDNGSNWQSSAVFAGLAPGAYVVKVREVDHLTCEDSYTFVVNDISGSPPPEVYFSWDVVHESVSGASDGRITLTPTSGVAPFTYSISIPPFYVAGNVFSNLGPGSYSVIVKDSNGSMRGAQITVNAGTVIFVKAYLSKNPIPISFSAPVGWEELVNFRKHCEVKVQNASSPSTYDSVLKQELYPASNGVCLFNLRQAFRNVFSPTPPTLNFATFKKLTDRSRLFKTVSGNLEAYATVPDPTTTSLPYLVVYGGLGMFQHASTDWLAYIKTYKKFLTWAPVEKWVDKYQEDYLEYFILNPLTTGIKKSITAYYDDDTNQVSVGALLSGTVYGDIYRVPAGPVNSGAAAINPAKTLIKYTITVLDQASAVVSEVRTYHVKQERHPNTKFILIVNSLGSHEVHLFTGQGSTQHQMDGDIIQKYLPPSYTALSGQLQSSEKTFAKKKSYSTGYLPSAAWQEYLTDLLLTRYFFDVTDGKRYPMVVTTKDMRAKEDQDYEFFVRFEALDAYQNPGYNPAL